MASRARRRRFGEKSEDEMADVSRAHRRMHVWRRRFVHSEVHLHGGFMGLVKLGPSGHLYLVLRRAGEE